MNRKGTLYWITGLAGAGKTTIGNALYYRLKQEQDNVVLLDGDILKRIVDETIKYDYESRKRRAFKYANLCKVLTDQDITVICCTIAMYEEIRAWNRKNNKGYIEVFLDVPMEILKERDRKGLYSKNNSNLAGVDFNVEFPQKPDVIIKNDGIKSIDECVEILYKFPLPYRKNFDRDVVYWDNFYNTFKINTPSLFAQEIVLSKKVNSGRKILDIGCGNGRDSLFFLKSGLDVIGIDISEKAINQLKKVTKNERNANFVCDDFVCSNNIYMSQYDYCYSRFSIHAINDEQQDKLITNIYTALKEEGLFFIEVRSIHDELYGKGKKIGKDEYIYDGHYRRFIRKERLEQQLKDVGFQIIDAIESRDLAPFQDSNPPVIRIVAKKLYEKEE